MWPTDEDYFCQLYYANKFCGLWWSRFLYETKIVSKEGTVNNEKMLNLKKKNLLIYFCENSRIDLEQHYVMCEPHFRLLEFMG